MTDTNRLPRVVATPKGPVHVFETTNDDGKPIYRISGPSGAYDLLVEVTNAERLQAHLDGFVEFNGGPLPRPIQVGEIVAHNGFIFVVRNRDRHGNLLASLYVISKAEWQRTTWTLPPDTQRATPAELRANKYDATRARHR